MDVIERIEKNTSMYLGNKMLSDEDLLELLRLAKQGQQMRWVPVSERLPEVSADYLCYDAHNLTHFIASWYKNKWYVLSNVPCSALWRVTHWMPLPEPPKE